MQMTVNKFHMEDIDGLYSTLINQDEKLLKTKEVLKDIKIIAYFFSASWCHRNNEILTKIQRVYEEAKKYKSSFEIIFVSCDIDDVQMLNHFKQQGNWYAFRFTDESIRTLIYKYNVTYVPCIIVCKPDGSIITKRGIEDIEKLGANVLITWSY